MEVPPTSNDRQSKEEIGFLERSFFKAEPSQNRTRANEKWHIVPRNVRTFFSKKGGRRSSDDT